MTPADITADDVQLARSIAHAAVRRLPARERSRFADDVLSDAMLGLVRAACDYDESRPVPFRAYAILRIRGALGDGFRYRRARTWLRLVGDDGADFDSPLIENVQVVDYGNTDPLHRAEADIALRQATARMHCWVTEHLTAQQRYVYHQLMAGTPRCEVWAALGVSESRVSIIVREIRRRVRDRCPVESPF